MFGGHPPPTKSSDDECRVVKGATVAERNYADLVLSSIWALIRFGKFVFIMRPVCLISSFNFVAV